MFKKTLLLLLILILFISSPSIAIQGHALSDGFGQLVLNHTTSEEAIAYLGKVESEKIDRIKASELERWLAPKHQEKIFRKLRFKGLKTFQTVELSFLENKLAMIELVFQKELPADDLRKLFGIRFAYWQPEMGSFPSSPDKIDLNFKPGAYKDRNYRVAASDKTFLLATCRSEGYFDSGRVERTIQVSRILEKK